MNRIYLGKDHETLDQELNKLKADLRWTEEKLQQFKENFSRTFTACPAALVISRVADGKFLKINKAYTRIMGHEPDEALGRTPDDMHIYVNPQERNLLMQQLQEKGCVQDCTLEVRNKSGDIRTLQVCMEPIAYDKEPTLICAFVDLTERNQMEAALHKSREKMTFALETSGIGTWEFDLTDRTAPHRSLRHDQIFGYENLLSEWTFEIFLEHVHPEDRSHNEAAVRSNRTLSAGI